jgi:hypothetical protein
MFRCDTSIRGTRLDRANRPDLRRNVSVVKYG